MKHERTAPGGYDAGSTHMIPEWFFVRYAKVEAGDGDCREAIARGQLGQHLSDGAVSLDFVQDGEVLTLKMTADADVRLLQCSLGFLRQFGETTRVLLNGYQSWTDTMEYSRDSRMPGMLRVPDRVVRPWVLDGSYDEGMAWLKDKPDLLHGFTYMDVRNGDEHELLASLDEDDGFTLLYVDAPIDAVIVKKECPNRIVSAGEQLTLCRLVLTSGSQDDVYDRWFQLAAFGARKPTDGKDESPVAEDERTADVGGGSNEIASRVSALPAPPIVGYTSWYRHHGDISASKLLVDLQSVRYALDDVNCDGFAKLFQIDGGYCRVGDWTDVREERFPKGLAPIASRICEAGFIPGIWVAPFVCERDSALFKEHPDWLLHDDMGKPVPTENHWSRSFVLDTLNPEVREHVCTSLRTLTQEWGFKLVKADFLYAACMMPHGDMNRGQLMADAMELLRQAVGEDVKLLACGVPLGSAFGRVEYCRIGCDAGLEWDDVPHTRLPHRERVSTHNSLANMVYRSPLDGRAFACDADVFFLCDDVKLTADQKEQLLAVEATYGSMLLTSDDMSAWDDRSRVLFQAAVDVLRQRKV